MLWFLGVGLIWGPELPVVGSKCPVLCFRDNHSLGVGEGGGIGQWESLLLTLYFPSPSLMSCGQCACLMPPSCVVGEEGLWEEKGTQQ